MEPMLKVFSGVLADPLVQLVDAAVAHKGGAEAALFHGLALEAELSTRALTGSAWQNHLLECLLRDENAFSRKAQLGGLENMGAGLVDAVKADLAELRRLFERPVDAGPFQPQGTEEPEPMACVLAASDDWASLVGALAAHFQENGCGLLARHRALRWVQQGASGHLEAITRPDPIRLEGLYAYDLERELLLANTEQFAAGQPANNVLLYGDRGTGKSSTIKALLQRFHRLRMVELAPDNLFQLPLLLAQLAETPHRCVLFVDDLSFEEFEVQYKHLKAVLEGGLEARPANVVIYATSNRKHLVKEHFSDLTKAIINDEIHQQDSVQEKLSLSDRFGITLTFPAPDQPRYLEIAGRLAAARGLAMDPAELRARAIRWAMYHNGFSGRTARQFVDYLEGQAALGRGAADSPL